jgi:hypothetical protein
MKPRLAPQFGAALWYGVKLSPLGLLESEEEGVRVRVRGALWVQRAGHAAFDHFRRPGFEQASLSQE